MVRERFAEEFKLAKPQFSSVHFHHPGRTIQIWSCVLLSLISLIVHMAVLCFLFLMAKNYFQLKNK